MKVALALVAVLTSGCGSKVREQDKSEPSGSFPVRVVSATFPEKQNLAKDSTMDHCS